MNRKTIFLALFSAFVTCFFVACSNDCDALDINVGTRSVSLSSYMTRDEIQDRLNEIGEKYGETILLTDDTDTRKITEEFFTWVENSYKNESGKKITEFGASIIDDEQINEIEIPEIGTYATIGENVCYTGTFTAYCNMGYKTVSVNITWFSNSDIRDYVLASCEEYEVTKLKYSVFSGLVSNPTFEYSFYINDIKFVGVYLGGSMSGEII